MVSARRMRDCDAHLLMQFREQADERAFEEIVYRYSSRVFGVCLKVLNDRQLAEDAAQDAFVTLACRAHRIDQPDSLGSWLHGVAFRKSIELRRRQNREQAALEAASLAQDSLRFEDLCEIVDEELGQLAAKYRVPLQLHYYDGLTLKQMSARTKIPVGTLSTRLQNGRRQLRGRLKKRGIKRGAVVMLVLLFWWSERAQATSFSLGQRFFKRAKRHLPTAPKPVSAVQTESQSSSRTNVSVIAIVCVLLSSIIYSTSTASANSSEFSGGHGWTSLFGGNSLPGTPNCNPRLDN